MKKQWLAHDTNSGCIRQSPSKKHCSIAADATHTTMVDTVTWNYKTCHQTLKET